MTCIAYYRVSTKGQGESGLGLEAQRAYIRHFLPAAAIIAEVTEVRSAKSMDRPVLQAALKRCREEGLTLAVAKLDRLSRRTEDALLIFDQLGGRLFAADVPNMDKFTLTLFMAIADRERELIGLRTRQALEAKRARGGKVHDKLGHRSNWTVAGRGKGALAKRLASRANLRNAMLLAREKRDNGKTLARIAADLNDAGYRTRRGSVFHPATVARMLETTK